MNPDQYCQQRAAASGSSFYYSFLFLPESRRRAITALYAFCREVDDVVDELSDPQVAMAKLAWWRGEVAALFSGTPQHPVTRALQPFVAPYRLTEARMNDVIDGMAMDLEQSRYADFDELERYCQRVAGVVGEMAAEIFGYVNPRTLEYARSLGIAFQLTNIIRDVGEDARRGRIYLPQQDLARFGVADEEILRRIPSSHFEPLMRFQAERALSFYRRARDLLPLEDRRAQRPGLVMAAIYRALLGEIEADRYRVLDRRIALTPLRKLWIAWRCWVFG